MPDEPKPAVPQSSPEQLIPRMEIDRVASAEAIARFRFDTAQLRTYVEHNQAVFAEICAMADIHSARLGGIFADAVKASRIYDRLFDDVRVAISSPVFNDVMRISRSMDQFVSTYQTQIGDPLRQAMLQYMIPDETLTAFRRAVEESRLTDLALGRYFTDMVKFNTLSQTALARIPWDQVGNALAIQEATRASIQQTFADFSRSYAGLFDFLGSQPSNLASLPPAVTRLASVEYFNGVNVLESITRSVAPDAELEEEKAKANEGTSRETADRLEEMLGAVNPDMVDLLRGARLALASDNPDRARHFVTSLRELFTHILHTLAPDTEIRIWSVEPSHYDAKGRPTRAARLLYICRPLNYDAFTAFVRKDVPATLEFLDLFHEGTHELRTPYSDLQLRAMLVRMESTLRYLLEISRGTH